MQEDANSAELKGDVCRFISSWWAARTIKLMNTPSSPMMIVSAGFPSPGDEYKEPPLDLRRLLGFAGEDSFCHLMGTSELSAAGICKHDLLVVAPSLEAIHQDIVLIEDIHGVWARRLIQSAGVTFLVPEDPANPNIPRLSMMPDETIRILGVVLCSIHPLNDLARDLIGRRHKQEVNDLLGLNRPEIFCVRVRGSSMQPAGIHDADVLVVDRGREARENDIIIASLDGAFFVKRFVKSLGAIFLLSDNPLSAPIAVSSQRFSIWGVVMQSVHLIHQALHPHSINQGRTLR